MIKPICKSCGEQYNPKRSALGYKICINCVDDKGIRDRLAKQTAPLYPKGNYMLITNKEQCKYINKVK